MLLILGKRGETTPAGNVATLISLIALFLLVYLLLLPQQDRDRILGDTSANGRVLTGEGVVLVNEFVGKVKPDEQAKKFVHEVANVNLFSREESGLVTLSQNLIVSKSFFRKNDKSLFFKLEPGSVLKSELFLVVTSGDGELVLKVNGNEFYRNFVDEGQLVLEIPPAYLSQSNTLEMSVDGFGSKSYSIRDIKLRKKEEIKNRVARRTFNIGAEEKSRMIHSVMRYNVFCEREEEDSLRISLNNDVVYTDVPFCNLGEESIELAPGFFRSGINSLDFETEGDYVVEGIHIKTFSGNDPVEEYFFTLEKEDFVRVRKGLSDVFATFEFSLRDDRKNFVLEINGEEIIIDTTKDDFLILLNEHVEEENLLRIVPKNSFEILEFKVVLE